MANYALIGGVLIAALIFYITSVFGYDSGIFLTRKFVDLMEWVTFWR